MRLLLDAHLSPQRIGAPLGALGHDVRCLAGDSAGVLDDPDVLALAAREARILVTRNSRDFTAILREWAEAGRSHGGSVLIWSLRTSQFAGIISGMDRLLAKQPDQDAWRGLVLGI